LERAMTELSSFLASVTLTVSFGRGTDAYLHQGVGLLLLAQDGRGCLVFLGC
jgi:hypothetical protein